MAMAGISANRLELLQIADAVAREKTIDKKIVIEAMEDAIQKAAKSRYGAENDIRCEIDPKTGEAKLTRVLPSSTRRKRRDADHRRGRQKAQSGRESRRHARRNAAASRIRPRRCAERQAGHRSEGARSGARPAVRRIQGPRRRHVNGTVKRVEYGNVIVDLGRAEGIIRRDEMIPRENVRLGDRIRAFIYEVRREQRGPQIFLTRARPEFMSALFRAEVPEIYDGVVEIKSVARDPGAAPKSRLFRRICPSTRSAPASA